MDLSSRFDSLPILRITDLLSSVKSSRRILQGTLSPASCQSSMTISLGHLFFVLVIMAKIVCVWALLKLIEETTTLDGVSFH